MKKVLSLLAILFVMGGSSVWALESYNFQDLCMKLGKGGPWAVNDGGDAGFTINEATMHYLGDYTTEGFSWNGRFAYEYVDSRGKFTMRNKSNKKDSNCGMFSWDYAHYFSILDLKDGDRVTITIGTGTVTFVSTNVEGEISAGDNVTSKTTYTISTTDPTTRLDIQMAKSSLIYSIVIEPYGVETVPEINVTPETLNLIPGTTAKLKATVTPSMATTWKSSDESVATVAADGTVTAVAAGTATITNSWESGISDATASDACVVTVADLDLSVFEKIYTYDFTTMGDVTLTLEGSAAGAIWNEGNSKNNDVFFCTNTGLEYIAVQAAVKDNKGWSIVDGKGMFLASGAGRCAAVGGITKDQIVEILYTGSVFYTKSADDGIDKTALNESTGRAIYRANENGMIGFELEKGNYVTAINIYDEPVTILTPKEYTTFVTTKNHDFSAVTGLEAYVATATTASTVSLEKVTIVPVGTPLILVGQGSFSLPVAPFASAPATNLLIAGPADLTGDGTEYVLSDGVFVKAAAGSLSTGKAYLKVPSEARELTILFGEDTTTGITNIDRTMPLTDRVYSVQGVRVAQPTKGLYIVNGKKMLMK